MTTTDTITFAPHTIRPVAIVYEVPGPRKAARVTVTSDYLYSCDCGGFTLYGECRHTNAVKAERQKQGRK
jgi:hypothetical protein